MTTVMLVEDEVAYQELWKDELIRSSHHCRVIQSCNLADAQMRFSALKDQIDVLVLDYELPDSPRGMTMCSTAGFRAYVAQSGFGGTLILTSNSDKAIQEMRRIQHSILVTCIVVEKNSIHQTLPKILAQLAA